ncbi:MAG TPA: hypothetical protein VLK27_05475 [Chthoniobacterales bacterium]|nr:hypothetical protein [Chthoniobacterales bacterium]
MKNIDIDRLLRNAAQAPDVAPAEMPFGFDTRVIALARRNGNGNGSALAALLRRVAVVAAAVIVFASAGAYLEVDRNTDAMLASGNEFAIADSAIQDEVAQ